VKGKEVPREKLRDSWSRSKSSVRECEGVSPRATRSSNGSVMSCLIKDSYFLRD